MTSRPGDDFDTLVALVPAPKHARAATVAAVGTRIDDWWLRLLSTSGRQRAWAWGGPIFVTVLAAVLRLWGLGHPGTLVFDETYYVKDAWSQHTLGYEGSWGPGVDGKFAAGHTNIFTSVPSFVAHPPLGKWFIGLGMAIFGPANPFGWRIAVATAGILAVLLLTLIATHLLRSTLLGVLAGFFMAIDGNAIVMSRVSLLDNFVMFFCLLGFGAILLDRGQSARRLDRWVARRNATGRDLAWGPMLWFRPWLFAAGGLFGVASAVKWNGVYFLVVFIIYSLVVDAVARRKAGVEFWATGTIFRQGLASVVLTVPIAVVMYLVGWTGWFVTKGGYDREWIQTGGGTAWKGALGWVPDIIQNFWHYEAAVYAFNDTLATPHPYQAYPPLWLLLQRPTSMFYEGTAHGVAGCTAQSCGEAILGLANPLIWYAAVAACLYLFYRLIRHREWRYGLILTGIVAGYFPWFLYLHRTVFQFYTIAFEPYLILGLVATLGHILGKRTDATIRRLSGIRLVAVMVVMSVLITAFFWPMWTAERVPWFYIELHYWLASWR